jgi:hypothetical protein
MGIFAVAHFTGVVFFINYSSYFFELAGLSASLRLSIGVSVSSLWARFAHGSSSIALVDEAPPSIVSRPSSSSF